MNCLYCDKEYSEYDLYTLFLGDDVLCKDCRLALKYDHTYTKLDDLVVESIYDYDSLFRSLILQYKECYDEALRDVFLCRYLDYLKIKYHGYQIVYVPSSKKKREERGFDHLKLIYHRLGLKEAVGLGVKEELIQEGKTYLERIKMKDNFYYDGPDLGKVLIVDDVMTSGSSLLGVYRALRGRAKYIRAFVLARQKR